MNKLSPQKNKERSTSYSRNLINRYLNHELNDLLTQEQIEQLSTFILASNVKTSPSKEKYIRQHWFWGLATSIVAFVLFWSWPYPINKTKQNKLTHKGISVRLLYAHSSDKGFQQTKIAQPNTILYPGDLVQFTYSIPSSMHLMIISYNQKGNISPVVLSDLQNSVKKARGSGSFPQKGSYTLDRFIGTERYFVFLGKERFGFNQVKQSMATAWNDAKGDLLQMKPTGPWSVYSFVFQKKKKHGETNP